jgi:hypothetical protein
MVIDLDEKITNENSASAASGQVTDLPTLAAARARLIEVIRQKPAPEPRYYTARDAARDAARGRRESAVRWLRAIPSHPTHVATVLGVTPRCVQYWRRGERAPTVKHWRQLGSLYALCCHTDLCGMRP